MAQDALRAGIALALSGGGFRATLFHVGTITRLNELGYLTKLDRISAVSGGSILAGLLGCHWETLAADGFSPGSLDRLVTQPLRQFCKRNIDEWAIAKGALSPWHSASDVLVEQYEELFEKRLLSNLPDAPRTIFNTTNLQTGRNCRISKAFLADYRIGQIASPKLTVARAVAASSAFPPVLAPCIVEVAPDSWQRLEGADLYDDPRYRHTLSLADGGVYDNLGLETIDSYQTMLVSDAGAPFALQSTARTDSVSLLARALDVATNQARGLRARSLIKLAKLRGQTAAYWGIDTRYESYKAPGKMACDPAKTGKLGGIRTRLNAFDDVEQASLINWGYALCDAAMRSFVETAASPPTTWPAADYPLS